MLYDFLESKGVFETIKSGAVVDVGSGEGKEGKVFEIHSFEVFYIEKKNGIDATIFEFPLNTYSIALAKNSLPFMGDKQFEVIENIYKSLKKDGYFYGTVFGFKDPWAVEGLITPTDFNDVKKYLISLGFEIVWFSEEEGIGKKMSGGYKNWHMLKFLVKKK